jgi:hypothetical protein
MFKWIDRDGFVLGYTFTPDAEMKRLAEEVWSAQDACNMSGLAQSFAAAMKKLTSHPQNVIGTDFVNSNPITLCWLDKFCDLAGMERDSGMALARVLDMREGEEVTVEIKVRRREHWDGVIAAQK